MEYIKTETKYGYCLTHGWTPFYKNGKCKDCAYKAIISVDGKPVVFDVRGKTAQTKGETIEE